MFDNIFYHSFWLDMSPICLYLPTTTLLEETLSIKTELVQT